MIFKDQILKRQYGEFVLGVPRLTLEFGLRVALLGENGSGKSTLVESIFNQEILQGGQYTIGEKNISRIDNEFLRRDFSFLLSQFPSALGLSVREVLGIGFQELNWQLADQMLKDFSLYNKIDFPFSFLSDGQKKLIMLTKCLSSNGSTLILDEPTTYLDSSNSFKVGIYLSDILSDKRKKLLFTSHDYSFCLEFSDVVYWIDHSTGSPLIAGPRPIEDIILDKVNQQNFVVSTRHNSKLSFLDEKCDVDEFSLALFKSYLGKKGDALIGTIKRENIKIKKSESQKNQFKVFLASGQIIETSGIAETVDFLTHS